MAMFAISLLLVAIGLFLIFFDQPLWGVVCIIAALCIGIAGALSKTGRATKAVAKGTTAGMYKELEAADTQSQGLSIAEQAVSNAGGFAGQQVFAPRKKQLRFKKASGWAELNQRLIDTFKKVFK